MPVRDLLPPVLRGENATDLSASTRAHLEAIAHEALTEKTLPALRDECAARLKQPNPTRSIEYLLAAACALNGEVERAHQTLLRLGEKLAEAKQWEALAAVAERALGLEETQAAARLLVKAHEGLKKDPERIEALLRAWQIVPDDLDLGLLLAVRYGEAGEGDQRRALLAELLPRFAEESRWAGLEECALEFVEHDDHEGLVRLAQTLPAVASKGASKEAKLLLDIAIGPLVKAGAAGGAYAPLRKLVSVVATRDGEKATEAFRAAMIDAMRQGPGRDLPDVEAVITQSGLADADLPLPAALQRYDAVAALAPGRAVIHTSFGAGRIVANDGESVFIDFEKSKRHRMPHAAALRTLLSLAEDDLRLVKATDPAELKRLRNEDPGAMLARALVALGGSADATRLKVFFVGSNLVAPADWTTFWRKARAAAEKEVRIDTARAFEQHYRLAPEGAASDDDTPLPNLEPRKPVKSNLATIRKFLSQHPKAEQSLARRFGRYVERAVFDEDGDNTDRARAGLYFSRWFRSRQPEWIDVLKRLWDRGLAVTDLPTEEEQVALLEVSHAAGVEADGILSALDSRFAAVRDVAQRYREHLDDRGRAELRRSLVNHATRYPQAALRLIEDELNSDQPAAERWALLFASLTLIEDRPKASLAEKILRWLEPHGPFERTLEHEPASEEMRLKVRVLLRQWRSSDRYLFPALEALERIGMGSEVEFMRNTRQQKVDKLFFGVGEAVDEAEVPVMTRATWELLQQELERLERELRTTIPATIQRARELGDLRENSEYHSAKLKQSNVSKLVASLQLKLGRARFVDEMEHRDGVAGLGTEVTLEHAGDITSYWILGDGEHAHGDHVISFQTPVGRALMGRTIGDEVELGEGEHRRRYRVVSIERKLPARSSTTAAE